MCHSLAYSYTYMIDVTYNLKNDSLADFYIFFFPKIKLL